MVRGWDCPSGTWDNHAVFRKICSATGGSTHLNFIQICYVTQYTFPLIETILILSKNPKTYSLHAVSQNCIC